LVDRVDDDFVAGLKLIQVTEYLAEDVVVRSQYQVAALAERRPEFRNLRKWSARKL